MSGPRNFAGGASARYLLLGATVFLSVAGVVMVYSASYVADFVHYGSGIYHLWRQAAFLLGGAAAAFLLAKWDYRRLKALAWTFWAASVGLVALTFMVGIVRGGAKRWLSLGFVNLQPSEIAKVACVILVSLYAAKWRGGELDDIDFAKKVAIATAVPGLAILLQKDLGTMLSLVLAVAVVLWLAGVRWQWFALGLGVVVAVGLVAIAGEAYRMARVQAFLNPWADPQGNGYQTVQALLAFGTGHLKGVGLGLSRQKFFYLPEAQTDFIYAIVGEELGLAGTLGILGGFAVFCLAGMRIAMGSRDGFGRLMAGGLTGMIGLQAFMNMAAVTGLMPVTGKPLPFMSYGGSSMLVSMACVGLLLSVSAFGANAPRVAKRPPGTREGVRGASSDQRGRNGRPHLSRIDGGGAVRKRA